MCIVKTDDLVKIYDSTKIKVHAIRGVTLDIQKGDFMSIAGPSGSGKTTLLNMIGGLDYPTSGRVILKGKDIETMSPGELSELRLHNLGFIFQTYNLISVLTAIENVEFVMLLQKRDPKERRDKAEQILIDVGLKDYINIKPDEMSGGQQQRVAVARAIVSEPILVLADEPTANLDSVTSGALLDMMRDLNETKGTTFVFSTHDKVVMDRAKKLVNLHDGKIVNIEEN